jgi:hypothetical protein
MRKRLVRTVVALSVVLGGGLAAPARSQAQSLGSVAKKERQRREKNKEKGVVSREFTEEVTDKKKDDAGETAAGEESSDKKSDADLPSPLSNLGPATDADTKDRDSEQENRDRRRSEAEWKARMQQARQNISTARERVQFFSDLYLAQGERYVDENGNTVVSTPAQLQSMTRKAKEDLAAAEKAYQDLQEEARHAGVPPGWLR